MKHSESIAAIAKALSAAQAEMLAPKKNRTGKVRGQNKKGESYEYEYAYADLAAVRESYHSILPKHGLSVVHALSESEGHVVLTTTILHESAEWWSSDFPIPATAKIQEFGSAITYGKRYNVQALFDLAAEGEDDDGAAAQASSSKKRAKDANSMTAPPPAATGQASQLTNEEIQSVYAMAKRAGLASTGALAPVLHNILGVSKASEIPKKELAHVLDALLSMAEQMDQATV